MSKIKPTLAIILAVFVICLSACGGSKDTDKIASQGDTGSSSAPIQESTSATGSSLQDSSKNKSEESSYDANRYNVGGVEDNDSYSDGNISERDDADHTSSPGIEDSGTDSRNNDNDKTRETEAADPTVTVSSTPQEKDNAEVDFNDL